MDPYFFDFVTPCHAERFLDGDEDQLFPGEASVFWVPHPTVDSVQAIFKEMAARAMQRSGLLDVGNATSISAKMMDEFPTVCNQLLELAAQDRVSRWEHEDGLFFRVHQKIITTSRWWYFTNHMLTSSVHDLQNSTPPAPHVTATFYEGDEMLDATLCACFRTDPEERVWRRELTVLKNNAEAIMRAGLHPLFSREDVTQWLVLYNNFVTRWGVNRIAPSCRVAAHRFNEIM